MDLPDYAMLDVEESGFDTLSIVVWIMCEEARGSLVKAKVGIRTLFGADDNLVSKFAAECAKGNLTPWEALDNLRQCIAKYFMPEEYFNPEHASAVHRERLEPAAMAAAARAAGVHWSGIYGHSA